MDSLYPPIFTSLCNRRPSKYMPAAKAIKANNNEILLNDEIVFNASKSIV